MEALPQIKAVVGYLSKPEPLDQEARYVKRIWFGKTSLSDPTEGSLKRRVTTVVTPIHGPDGKQPRSLTPNGRHLRQTTPRMAMANTAKTADSFGRVVLQWH